MTKAEILQPLKQYIVHQILDGRDAGLDETTPLLEWGIVNSLEMVRLISFIHTQFHVEIPSEKIVAEHFTTLAALTNLVQEMTPQTA